MSTSTKPFSKKLYNGYAHPAVFNGQVLLAIVPLLDDTHKRVLDPFAGIGGVHALQGMVDWKMETIGVEIEPEWANFHPQTYVGNALKLNYGFSMFDAVITSPCYGNRLADKHVALDDSYRRSYTHDLGRDLNESNSGSLQWGQAYRDFHERAWDEVARVLKPGGHLILNISDHIRGKKRIHVASWHTRYLLKTGFELEDVNRVHTTRHRVGENREARVDSELVLKFLFA